MLAVRCPPTKLRQANAAEHYYEHDKQLKKRDYEMKPCLELLIIYFRHYSAKLRFQYTSKIRFCGGEGADVV